MYCDNCGAKIPDKSTFCPECGQQLEKEGKEIPNEGRRVQNTVYFQQPRQGTPYFDKSDPTTGSSAGLAYDGGYLDESNDNDTENTRKSQKPIVITLSVLIVCLVGAVVWAAVTLVGMDSKGEQYVAPTIDMAKKESAEKGGLNEIETDIGKKESADKNADDSADVENIKIIEDDTTDSAALSGNNASGSTTSVTPQTSGTTASTGDYIIADSSTRVITTNDLSGLSDWQIKLARNEIYARRGRIFVSAELDQYFRSKSWYKPSIQADNFNDDYLSSTELANVKTIVAYEKAHNINQ